MLGIDAQIQGLLEMMLRLLALATLEVCHAEMIAIDRMCWLGLDDFLEMMIACG